MRAKPIGFKDACAFIATHHRHHRPPFGYKFAIGAVKQGELVAVATVGRPVARHLDDGWTAEVTRLCTDGTRNACSFLYQACARTAKEMGYQKIITYILDEESGTSLRATGWMLESAVRGSAWSRPSRPRSDAHPLGDKQRWSRQLAPATLQTEAFE